MARFSVDVRVDGTDCEIFVGGEVDSTAADQLSTVGALAIDKSRAETVVVDLARVDAFDETGTDALRRIHDACTEHAKDLYLRNVPEHVQGAVAGIGLATI